MESERQENRFMYVCMGFYLVVLIAIAAKAYVRKRRAMAEGSSVDAHFGGQFSAPLLVLTTFSTIYSGFTVTGVPAEAYLKGFMSLRWVGATMMVVLGMIIVYPRLRRLAVVRGYKSPSDFITDRYRSRRLRCVCAVCAVLPMLIYLTAQMVSFASMIEGITGGAITKLPTMFIFAVLILGLEKLGGMNSVVFTDACQAIVMVGAFLVTPFVLGQNFGWLWEVTQPHCESLVYVEDTRLKGSQVASTCPGPGEGCLPSGCLAAVQPDWYKFPTYRDQSSIFFFLLNMIAAPLQPHMVQRVYIASSDRDLKLVMFIMLIAPLIAQTPGILIGLTKATFEREWPHDVQEATAFAAITDQMMTFGWFERVLATLLTCSTLAAIMSTADSVLMGASSLVSIDIYKGVFDLSAPSHRIVRVGEAHSVFMALCALVLGTYLSVANFGRLLTLQNGLAMQLLPAYFLGLYSSVRERPILLGILTGLGTFLLLSICGNPLDGEGQGWFMPTVNVSVMANFAMVVASQLLFPGSDERPSSLADDMRKQFGEHLSVHRIRGIMSASLEPKLALVLLMVGLATLSIPWPIFDSPGAAQDVYWGLPRWGVVTVSFYIAVMLTGHLTVLTWRPRGVASGYSLESSKAPGDSCIGEPGETSTSTDEGTKESGQDQEENSERSAAEFSD